MIGRLAGVVLHKLPPEVLLDVGGVGYELEVPMSTFYELPDIGQSSVLLVHMLVREDAQLLYGFASQRERQLFRLLLKVNGVGAKVALAILSTMSADDFIVTVEREDIAALIRIPGVGKKTAERLVIELRDKIKSIETTMCTIDPASDNGSTGTEDTTTSKTKAAEPGDSRLQAIDALVALGYKPAESTRMVDKAIGTTRSADLAVEDIIRTTLRSTVTS